MLLKDLSRLRFALALTPMTHNVMSRYCFLAPTLIVQFIKHYFAISIDMCSPNTRAKDVAPTTETGQEEARLGEIKEALHVLKDSYFDR